MGCWGDGGYMVATGPLFVQHVTSALQVDCVTDSSKSASAQLQWENP